MKRVFLLMTTILLMAAASGCMQTPQEKPRRNRSLNKASPCI